MEDICTSFRKCLEKCCGELNSSNSEVSVERNFRQFGGNGVLSSSANLNRAFMGA